MLTQRVLTQTHTKRIAAAALAELKVKNHWSSADLADAMGCADRTVANRLCDEEPNNALTLHELRRLVQAGELGAANAIFADLGVRMDPIDYSTPIDAITASSCSARCTSALIEAAPGGYSVDEWRVLLPMLEQHDATISNLIQQGRRAIAQAGER